MMTFHSWQHWRKRTSFSGDPRSENQITVYRFAPFHGMVMTGELNALLVY